MSNFCSENSIDNEYAHIKQQDKEPLNVLLRNELPVDTSESAQKE